MDGRDRGHHSLNTTANKEETMRTRRHIALIVISLALALALAASMSGCGSALQDQLSSVRFQNLTDFNIFYGVKFGDAEYYGPVSAGYTTGYIAVHAGTYSLQALNASGQWITISSGSMTISGGHRYSIVGTGTGGYYYWTVVQDN